MEHDILFLYSPYPSVSDDEKNGERTALKTPEQMDNSLLTGFWNRYKILLKGSFIGLLTLLLLIPTFLIQNLVKERWDRQQQALTEVSSRWAGLQTVTGPVIGIPY